MTSTIKLVYTVLEVLSILVCCLGNLLVIWAVWKCGAMRRQPTFFFIVSLAIADSLVGVVVVPIRILTDDRVEMSFYGCLVLSCGMIFFPQVSVFLQLALTGDRFLRVIIPLRYKSTVTLKHCWWQVAVCWLMAAIVGFIPLMGWNNHNAMSQNRTECQFLDVVSLPYLVYVYFFTGLLFPILVMIILYSCIFTIIHRQLRRTSIVSHSYFQKERSLTCSLVLVLVLFAICWLPIHLMNVATFYGTRSTVPTWLFYAGLVFSQANSAINPIIYALKIQHIQAPLKTRWRRFFQGKVERQVPRNRQATGTDNCRNSQDAARDMEVERVETTVQDLP